MAFDIRSSRLLMHAKPLLGLSISPPLRPVLTAAIRRHDGDIFGGTAAKSGFQRRPHPRLRQREGAKGEVQSHAHPHRRGKESSQLLSPLCASTSNLFNMTPPSLRSGNLGPPPRSPQVKAHGDHDGFTSQQWPPLASPSSPPLSRSQSWQIRPGATMASEKGGRISSTFSSLHRWLVSCDGST
jgi:hypothetical protein